MPKDVVDRMVTKHDELIDPVLAVKAIIPVPFSRGSARSSQSLAFIPPPFFAFTSAPRGFGKYSFPFRHAPFILFSPSPLLTLFRWSVLFPAAGLPR